MVPEKWAVWVWVELDDAGDAATATISGGDIVGSLSIPKDETTFEFDWEYLSEAEMDAEFPNNSTYTITLSGGTMGTVSQQIVMGAANFPSAPTLAQHELGRASSLIASQGHLVRWQTPPAEVDAVFLEVNDDEDEWEYADTATSGTLPANTMAAGQCVEAGLIFDVFTDISGAGGFGVDGYYSHASLTRFGFNSVLDLTPEAIVGAWQFGDGAAGGSGVLVFQANGLYYHAEDISVNDEPWERDGMERGTYSWNPDTGAFSSATQIDTNGEIGLSDPASALNMQVDGDSLTITEGGDTYNLSRVAFSATNPLQGGWMLCDNKGMVTGCLVFLSNNTYYHMEVFSADGSNGNDDDGGKTGMERGSYSFNPATGRLDASAINPDKNLEYGLSHPIVGHDDVSFSSPRVMLIDDTGGVESPGVLHRVSNARVFEDWRINKEVNFTQTADDTQPTTPIFWDIWSEVTTRNPGDASAITLSGGGIIGSLSFDEEYPGEWTFDKDFDSEALMNGEFPDNATYTITLSGGALGTLTQEINIGSGPYPPAPYLTGTVFTDAKSIDPAQPFTIQWNGSPDYAVVCEVYEDSDDGGQYFSSDELGSGESQVTLPPGTLPANSRSYGYLEFGGTNVTDSPGAVGFGVSGFSARISVLPEIHLDTSPPAEAQLNDAIAAAGLSGDDAPPLAEPFGDGVPNLLKYAFNMNLAGPDTSQMAAGGNSGLPGGGLVEAGGQTFWQVEYVRRKGSGLVYTPKKSTTLVPESFVPLTGTQSVTSIDGEWERVTVNEPCDPATTATCFSHVDVTLP